MIDWVDLATIDVWLAFYHVGVVTPAIEIIFTRDEL